MNCLLDFLLGGEPVPQESHRQAIEIPGELGELAEESGLTYRQTLQILESDSSIVARRSPGKRDLKNTDDGRVIYESIKQFLEES